MTATKDDGASRSADRRTQLVDVVIELTATRGLDAVSVREVAAAAGVSIGTVQHYFGTKDAMLVAAFERVVERTRQRVGECVTTGSGVVRLSHALEQLLPLDEERDAEIRVYVCFAARAATTPALAAIQGALLRDLRAEVAAVLGGRGAIDRATVLLAVVDGLALQQVSSAEPLPPSVVRRALTRAIAAAG